MEPSTIKENWRRLLADMNDRNGTSSVLPSMETDTTVSSGKVRLAISDGVYCALLLPLAITDSVDPDQLSQLISVKPVKLDLRGKPTRFLEVRCEEENLEEVFARVVGDVLRRIEGGTTSIKAVDEAVREFRRLVHEQSVGARDEKEIVGLIGELLTLLEVLHVNPRKLNAWHGPDSDRHDFRSGGVTVEVKTSLGADGNTIHINGVRQLESGENDCLLIRHVRIEPDPKGDLSVPDLVSRVSALAYDQILLDKKLEQLGYTADTADGWAVKRYRSVGSTTYHVYDGFPRLVPESLSVEWPLAGVSAVSYKLDLGAASDFRIDDANWETNLKEFCS